VVYVLEEVRERLRVASQSTHSTDLLRLIELSIPEVVQKLLQDQVDIALLVAV
jgi:hypothetical protein